jgi:putative ABC transport system permease protein
MRLGEKRTENGKRKTKNESPVMLKNYFKIAWRSLLKNKLYSTINLAGLAIGLAVCLIIGLYVKYELSYDRFHGEADQLHRIYWHSSSPQPRTPHPMALAMVKDLPEVVAATSLTPVWGPGLTRPAYPVRYGDAYFEEKEILAVDTTFFELFDFPFIYGDAKSAMKDPASVLITESTAKKYFGDKNPLGEVLRMGRNSDFKVSAVLADVPANSHFTFDFLLTYPFYKARESGAFYTWDDFGHYNYVKLAQGTDLTALTAKLPLWAKQYIDFNDETMAAMAEGNMGFRLQPVTDIHLHSNMRWELGNNSHVSYIYILGAAALFILILACINFTNLTTARSLERAKEIGLRKTLGAQRKQLAGQFLGESILFCLLSLLLAFGLVDLGLPWVADLVGKPLALDMILTAEGLVVLAGVMGFVALLAGAYPAFYLSSFQPLAVLRGRFTHSREGNRFRKGLVVLQFAASGMLIIGTLFIFRQLDYLQNAHLGFDKEQVLVVPMKGDLSDRYQTAKAVFKQDKDVLAASAISNVPGSSFNNNSIQWKDQDISVAELSVDEDFFSTLGIEITAGRAFSLAFGADSQKYMLNEEAVRQFDWENPLGESLIWEDDDRDKPGELIGIVKDFHFKSLHEVIGPMAFKMEESDFNYLLLKVNTSDLKGTLSRLESQWQQLVPAFAFTYSFLDDDFGSLYQSESRMSTLMLIFAGLAMLIACLGLFGLVSFAAQQRMREIGIRKVLGADARQIVLLLSKDFIKLVLVSFLLAVPLAAWLISNWLENFAYSISLSAGPFLVAAVASVVIAMVTLGFRALKAASANPVEVLRRE